MNQRLEDRLRQHMAPAEPSAPGTSAGVVVAAAAQRMRRRTRRRRATSALAMVAIVATGFVVLRGDEAIAPASSVTDHSVAVPDNSPNFTELLAQVALSGVELSSSIQALGQAPQCGVASDADPAARRCFLDAVMAGNVAVVLERYDIEGSTTPQVYAYRSRPDGTFDWAAVTSADTVLIPHRCEGIIANELLNAWPPPDYHPLFSKIHGCSPTATELTTLDDPLPQPPEWFLAREPVPSCGFAFWHPGSSSWIGGRKLSVGATDCLATELALGQPVEVAYMVERRPDGHTTRWFRGLVGGQFELIEQVVSANRATWVRYSCERPAVARDGTASVEPVAALGCIPAP